MRQSSTKITSLKTTLARLLFKYHKCKKDFHLIPAEIKVKLKKTIAKNLVFQESICNAGMVRQDNGYTLVAKNQQFNFCAELKKKSKTNVYSKTDSGERVLYRIELNNEFVPIECRELQVWLDGERLEVNRYIEDVRLLSLDDHSILAYATGFRGEIAGGPWPLYGWLDEDQLRLHTALFNAPPCQKNWIPFLSDGRVFVEYSVVPHVVLELDTATFECKVAGETNCPIPASLAYLHGGAPACRLDKDTFLGAGNSQHLYWFQDRFYASVFYLFDAEPPFAIRKVSKPCRLISRSERIHYLSGLLLDSSQSALLLSYGICDCDNWVCNASLDNVMELFR